MTAPELRPYQTRGVELARAARRSGKRRILLCCPTGGGKSVLATHLAHRASVDFLQRILVVVHSGELANQWYVHFSRCGITAGIMRADDERTDASCSVQIGTSATLVRRDLPPADIVIVDECSMAVADTFARILAAYPKATILGLTATPCRLDGRPLSEQFDAIVEVATYSELIACGAIMAPIVYAPTRAIDLSKVRKVAGDYDKEQIDRKFNQPHVIGNVVAEWREKAMGRRTIVFAVSIEHSKSIVEQFVSEGVKAVHVDGTSSWDGRQDALLDLYLGKIQVLSGVNVFSYGLDVPPIKCAVIARPTLSLALHMQMAGRILRPWEGVVPIVLDHASNTERHGLPHEDRVWSLEGKVQRVAQATAHHVCKGCFAYVQGNPCPLCGFEAPVQARELRTAPGALVAVGGAPGGKDGERRAYFERQVDRARHQGFKPGFASAKYKEKYGEWPPWAWGQAVKADFQSDKVWQEDARQREATREHWKSIQEAKVQKLERDLAQYTPEPEEA